MTFKDLQRDYIVYVLDKTEMTSYEAKVASVSPARFENKPGGVPGMVVDVTLVHDGQTNTYVFPDSVSKAFSGNKMFCLEKKDLLSDVKAVRTSAETAIAEVEKHKDIVAKCNKLLADLDTEYKEKQAMESRLDKIETLLTTLIAKGV